MHALCALIHVWNCFSIFRSSLIQHPPISFPFTCSPQRQFSNGLLLKLCNKFSISRIDVFEERIVNKSLFRTLLLRGDIPCCRSFCKPKDNKHGSLLMWKIAPQDLDYCYYLPIFFDGWVLRLWRQSNKIPISFLIRLCEPKFPYNIMAGYAIHDMLNAAGEKVLPVIPQIIVPIKNALRTKHCGVIAATLRILQHLCMCGECYPACGKAFLTMEIERNRVNFFPFVSNVPELYLKLLHQHSSRRLRV